MHCFLYHNLRGTNGDAENEIKDAQGACESSHLNPTFTMAKKKTKLKPVARPFATTSIPSTSKKPEPKEPTASDDTVFTNDSTTLLEGQDEAVPPTASVPESDPFQIMIDALQPKVDKEINRILKVSEDGQSNHL